MQKALAWILACTPILLVVTWSNEVIDPALTSRTMVVGVLTVLTAVVSIFHVLRNHTSLLNLPLALSWLGYVACCVWAWNSSVNEAEGLFDLVRIATIFMVWLLAVHVLASSEKALHKLAVGVMLTGLIAQEEGIRDLIRWQMDPERPTFDWGVVRSTMANRNLYSTLLFMSLPFAGWLWFNTQKHRKWILAYFIITLINALVVQTQSVQLACVASVLVVVGIYAMHRVRWLSVRLVQVMAVGVFLGAAVPMAVAPGMLKFAMEKVAGDIESAPQQDLTQSSVNKRLHMWYHSAQMIEESPIRGKGLASWKLLVPSYGQVSAEGQQGLRYAQRPHNDFLWVLSETGIAGYIFFVFIFLYSLCLVTVKYVRSSDNSLLFWIAAIVGYMVISSFSFPKERVLLQVMLALTLAVVVTRHPRTSLQRVPKLSWMTIALVVAGVGSFTTYAGWMRYQGEALTVEVYRVNGRGNNKAIVRAASEAMNPYYNLDPATTPISWYKGVGHYQAAQVAEAVSAFEMGVSHNPNHIPTYNNLGSGYVQLGEMAKARGDMAEANRQFWRAVVAYRKAIEISPLFTEALCNLSAVYYNLGRNDEALETIITCPARADHLLPDTYEPYVQAIVTRKFLQMKREAYPAVSNHMMDSLLKRTDYLVDTFRDAANAREDFVEHLMKKDRFRN